MTVASSHVPAVDALDGRRLFFIDWLRVIAVAILVLFHTGMYYSPWEYHVKSPFAGPANEPWMLLSSPWRMSLLFMVSGAATAYMLARGVRYALVRRRSIQLLLPLLFGMAVVVPPQSYVEVVGRFGYTGSFFDFLPVYFGGHSAFCQGHECLILPTWNHLWFLMYLWAYSMLVFGLLSVWPNLLQATGRWVDRVLAHPALLLLLPMLLLLAVRHELFWRWPSTHAFKGDWFNHATYFPMFVLGLAFAASSTAWQRMADLRWLALGLAAAFWAALAFLHPHDAWGHVVTSVYQWSALVCAFGFARRHLNVDHPWRARLSEAVFPFYILHQTIILVGTYVLLPLRWPPLVEGPVLVASTFLLGCAGCEAIRHVDGLRRLFGFPKRDRAPVPRAAMHRQG